MHFLYIVGLSGASRPDLIGEASGLEPSGPVEVLLSKVGRPDFGDRRRVENRSFPDSGCGKKFENYFGKE